MTNRRKLLWLLRIYGPCSIAELLAHTDLDRYQILAAMNGLRAEGLAERCMHATYRLTDWGRQALAGAAPPAAEPAMPLFEAPNS